MSDIKNQHTLFRFISLRSPEQIKEEAKDSQHVQFPEGEEENSIMISAATDTTDSNATKWEKLLAAAETFTAYSDLDAAKKAVDDDLGEMAIWLAQHPEATDAEVYAKIDALKAEDLLDSVIEVKIWDNLIYQVVTQDNFYVKEFLIQLLRLNKLVSKKLEFMGEEGAVSDDFLPILAKLRRARVVLPAVLFDESEYGSTSSGSTRDLVPTNAMLGANEVAKAKVAIENATVLISELDAINADHQAAYQAAYKTAVDDHQATVKPLLDTYESDYKTALRGMCASRDENYNPDDICYQPDIAYPDLPEFTFDYAKEPDLANLSTDLSADSYEALGKLVNLSSIKQFSKLKPALEQVIETSYRTISDKSPKSKRTLVFGGTAVSLETNSVEGSDFVFQVNSEKRIDGSLRAYVLVQLPHAYYDVSEFSYQVNFIDGTKVASTALNAYKTGTVLTLDKMFNDELSYSDLENVTSVSGTVSYTNGAKRSFSVAGLDSETGYLEDENIIDDGLNVVPIGFKPQGFGYRRLGIADYRKVVSEVCCYEAGEVAHIENVMARELREKVTTKTHKTETTETESVEVEKESLSDVVSTQRFEMQTEISKILQEDSQKTNENSSSVDASVSGKSPGYNFAASFGSTISNSYASSMSKEESNRQAVKESQELTERAMERVVSRVRTEKTVKVTEEFIEQNMHAFDNRTGDEHVSGVFRFVNAVYKNQIHNYGKRLTYEFLVPQPSKLHRLAMAVSKSNVDSKVLKEPEYPTIPVATGPVESIFVKSLENFSELNQYNYKLLVSKYNVDVDPYPVHSVYVNANYSTSQISSGTEIIKGTTEVLNIPEGFETYAVDIRISTQSEDNPNLGKGFALCVGNLNLAAKDVGGFMLGFSGQTNSGVEITGHNGLTNDGKYLLDNFRDTISIVYSGINHFTYGISISVECRPTREVKENGKWLLSLQS